MTDAPHPGPGYSSSVKPTGPMTGGPTIEAFVKAGYNPAHYPPEGFAEVPSQGLTNFKATGHVDQAPPVAGTAAKATSGVDTKADEA